MERCANTEALNAYMADIDKEEKRYESLQSSIKPMLNEISSLVEAIKEQYELYGFEICHSEIAEMIMDL